MLAGINYNMLSSLMNMLLFFSVQGALIKSFVGFDLPIELVAAVLLALVAAATVTMELAQAVVLWRWSVMAQQKYAPQQLSLLARARGAVHSTTQRISQAARSAEASVKRRMSILVPAAAARPTAVPRPVPRFPAAARKALSKAKNAPSRSKSVVHHSNPLRR
jgi:hypothetical protein